MTWAGRPEHRARRQGELQPTWKAIEVVVPTYCSEVELRQLITDHVRVVATDAGEFVQAITVGRCIVLSAEHHRCEVSYLPGPPGKFPTSVGVRSDFLTDPTSCRPSERSARTAQ